MIETIAIVIGVVTGLGAIGGASYKIYHECHNDNVINEITITSEGHTPPSPMVDKIIKDAVKHHMNLCDNDSDTEIDIKIHIYHNDKE